MADGLTRFGQLVDERREAVGLSKAGLAKRLGKSRTTLWRELTGRTAIAADDLGEYARALEMSIAELAEAAAMPAPAEVRSPPTPAPRLPGPELPRQAKVWLAEFRVRLLKGGATDDEVEEAITLLSRPEIASYELGGLPPAQAEAEIMRNIQGIAEAVIVPTLRRRGRKL